MLEDLAEGRVPNHYKVYIFPDALYLTAAEQAAIDQLKSEGRTLVWHWAPGFVTDAGLSQANMEQLTGFQYDKVTADYTASQENFEGGSFPQTSYTGGFGGSFGTVTSDPNKKIGGSYSAFGTAPGTTDWYEFLYSDPNKIHLEPGATYNVTFNAMTVSNPGSYFYFLARSAQGGNDQDVGFTQWTTPAGGTYTKSFTFTLKPYADYKLIWGIRDGGGLSIDDISIKKVRDPLQFTLNASLFPGNATAYGDTTLNPVFHPKAISGVQVWGSSVTGSRPAIAVKDNGSWKSVYSSTIPIPAQALKRIYEEAVHVYSESLDNLEANRSWIMLHAAASGPKKIRLPAPGPVYDIIQDRMIGLNVREFHFNMQKGETAIFVLDNPPVHQEDFEGGTFAQTGYIGGYNGNYGSLTSAAGQKIGGSYSAYGTAASTVDWHEFLYSDKNKIRLEPGATYTVAFKGKTVTNPGGFFYFLARTGTGGAAEDVGVQTWTNPTGAVYTKNFTFTLKSINDYYLIWGIHNGGGLSIDDITITRQ